MSIFENKKDGKGAFLKLDKKEEKLIEEIKEEADKEVQELLETLTLIKDIKNRGLYILEKIKDLNTVLDGAANTSRQEFKRREYISATLDIIKEQINRLKTEELAALKEEEEEDKLEKFIINLTKKADKIAERAKKETKEIE